MAGHRLRLLTEKLYNTPHLIEPQSFETVVNYLTERNKGEMLVDSDSVEVKADSTLYNEDTKVGMIEIQGPLTYKPYTVMGFDCGGTSYQGVLEQMESLVEQGMKTLVLNVDSGGGEAYSMMETGDLIRKMADDNGVTIISYIDGMSASAAYGLTAISDQIVMNPEAEVGSIGVVVRLMNDSKALEKEGYERTYVHAGSSKVPFDKEGAFREDFISDIQEKVDTLYEGFTGYVAKHRNISVEAVRSTEAKTFLSKKALELGLADAVMTHLEFYSHLADVAQKENPMLKTKLFGMNKEGQSFDMNELELAKSELSELGTKYEAQAADLQLALAGVQDLQAKLAEAQGVVAEFKAAQDKAELEAKEAVAATRKAALVASIGEDQAATLSASLEGVSDAQYEAVVAAVTKANAALVENPLFKEMGADVEVETNPDMEDALAKLIQKTYKTK